MPTVRRPGVLQAVYHRTLRMIRGWQIPTQLIMPDTTLYRAVDIRYLGSTTREIFPRQNANRCLMVRDEDQDRNRFSGQSLSSGVPNWGGLYCSLQ